MIEPIKSPDRKRESALHDLSDDALGFGQLELRTAVEVVLRPRQALDAWMSGGSSGHGRYARPLRLYLALNAILMLLLFLRGGSELLMVGLPEEPIQALIRLSGKSRDAFLADADGWMTLIMVPILSGFYALFAAPLLRWWDAEDLGWRRAFRAAFAYLCAWTVPILPVAWWGFSTGPARAVATIILLTVGLVMFMRMGAGRWWRTWPGGLGKSIVFAVALQIAGMIGFIPILAIGLLAGVYA